MLEQKRINRIKEMEEIMDKGAEINQSFFKAYDDLMAFSEDIKKLADYYENGGYQEDFKADEEGLIPNNLKRGVLDEDSCYEVISDYFYIKDKLLKKKS